MEHVKTYLTPLHSSTGRKPEHTVYSTQKKEVLPLIFTIS